MDVNEKEKLEAAKVEVKEQKSIILFRMAENYSRVLSVGAALQMLEILDEMSVDELKESVKRLMKKKPYDRMPTAGMIWDDYTDHRKVKINVREVWSQERAQEFLKDK